MDYFLKLKESHLWLQRKFSDWQFFYLLNHILKYQCGEENSNADFCSRFPSPKSNERSSIHNKVYMSELIYSPIKFADVVNFLKKNLNVKRDIDYILNGWHEKVNDQFNPYLCHKILIHYRRLLFNLGKQSCCSISTE